MTNPKPKDSSVSINQSNRNGKDHLQYFNKFLTSAIICLLIRKKKKDVYYLCGSHTGEAEHADLVSDVLPVPRGSYTKEVLSLFFFTLSIKNKTITVTISRPAAVG